MKVKFQIYYKKISIFDAKLINDRKIQIIYTIDLFWNIILDLPKVLVKDQVRFFKKILSTENEDIYGNKIIYLGYESKKSLYYV